MLRNRAKRKYGTVAQKIQFLGFYRTAIIVLCFTLAYGDGYPIVTRLQYIFSNRSFRAQPFLKVPIYKESPASIKFAGDSYSNHKARNVL